MKNKYSFSEIFKNIYSLVLTKIFFNKARLIRRPIYIRGKKSIDGGINLTTGRFCRMDLDGRKKTLTIGENCQIGDFCHIVALDNVTIGKNVLIASKVFISDTSHGSYTNDNQDSPFSMPVDRKLVYDKVEIGDNVWIGDNVVILQGSSIGSGSIIGANAVVTGKIPDNSIAVGVPARVIKTWNSKSNTWCKV